MLIINDGFCIQNDGFCIQNGEYSAVDADIALLRGYHDTPTVIGGGVE